MTSCPGHACFILRHCAYFLSHLSFVSLHSGCVTVCMSTTPLFLHSSFARILTYLVDALAPSGLLEKYVLSSRDPCIRDHLHIFCISLFLYIPGSPHTYIPKLPHPYSLLYPYTPIHTCPETPTFLYPYIPISLFAYPYYSSIPIPTCPYVSLNS